MRLFPLVLIGAAVSSCEKATPELAPSVADTSRSGVSPPAVASGNPKCLRRLPQNAPTVRPGPDPRCPRDPAGGPPMVPAGHVTFEQATQPVSIEVELMLSEEHRERGLMYRKSLDDGHGMLFAWPKSNKHQFWMHNTCLPLDMMFIDSEGYIAGIVENAPTLNDEPRSIDCAVPFVLEVNAGWSRKHGVAPGQRLAIEGVPFRPED